MRILGVDPGSIHTGWGLLGGTGARPQFVECGVIVMRAAEPLPARLHALRCQFEAIVRRLAPTEAAVESPFHGLNARSALQLSHARGVVLEVLGGAGLLVVEYPPAAVKKAVTGSGRAEKDQVQGMIARLFGPDAAGRSSDAADALGVALCHAASLGLRSALRRAQRS